MSHWLSPGTDGEGEGPSPGQNVPPDAEEQLPAPLSLLHSEKGGGEQAEQGSQPAERSLDRGHAAG